MPGLPRGEVQAEGVHKVQGEPPPQAAAALQHPEAPPIGLHSPALPRLPAHHSSPHDLADSLAAFVIDINIELDKLS